MFLSLPIGIEQKMKQVKFLDKNIGWIAAVSFFGILLRTVVGLHWIFCVCCFIYSFLVLSFFGTGWYKDHDGDSNDYALLVVVTLIYWLGCIGIIHGIYNIPFLT